MAKELTKELIEYAETIKEELIYIRRSIHKNPEIGLQEFETARLVAEYLTKLGLEIQTGVNKTGVIGLLRSEKPGKTLLMRADMDALPICEMTDVEYKSQKKNIMHACGHDAHTAWLLGAANILSKYKKQLKGNVKFVFQPCEESGGAKKMISEGILQNPNVDAAIAAHVFPELDCGKVGIKSGPVTSTPSDFTIKVIGKSGHASQPCKCIDPIMILNQIYMGIQNINRSYISSDHPSVISVTVFNGGQVHNVIPEVAEMHGTIRTFSYEDNKIIADAMKRIAEHTVEMYGAQCEFKYDIALGSTINNEQITKKLKESAEKILKSKDDIVNPPIFMGGDDFAYISTSVPSNYFFVGVRNETKGIVYPIHSDKFNLDENCIHTVATIMAQFAIDYLN